MSERHNSDSGTGTGNGSDRAGQARERSAERATETRRRPPGSQYEDPGTALTPSAGQAGATGPGGTGRSDMRDIGAAAAGAGSRYGTPGDDSDEDLPDHFRPVESGAGGIPRPKGFSTGVAGQVSDTLLHDDDSPPGASAGR